MTKRIKTPKNFRFDVKATDATGFLDQGVHDRILIEMDGGCGVDHADHVADLQLAPHGAERPDRGNHMPHAGLAELALDRFEHQSKLPGRCHNNLVRI